MSPKRSHLLNVSSLKAGDLIVWKDLEHQVWPLLEPLRHPTRRPEGICLITSIDQFMRAGEKLIAIPLGRGRMIHYLNEEGQVGQQILTTRPLRQNTEEIIRREE